MKINIFSSFVLFLPFFFSACAEVKVNGSEKSIHISKPSWLLQRESLSYNQAVGFSPPNFQGMYIQRIQAITKAREILTQRISAHIISSYKEKLHVSDEEIIKKYGTKITMISQGLLKNSYQFDAFLDKKNNLYVLVEMEETPQMRKLSNMKNNKVILSELDTTPFKINALLDRRCYAKSVLLQAQTKSPMYNDYPIWFYRPNWNMKKNSDTSIGIAEKIQTSTFTSQKRTAIALAKLTLVKKESLVMKSLDTLTSIVLHDELGQTEDWKINTQTSSRIKRVKLLDIWINPHDCELYVWVKKLN